MPGNLRSREEHCSTCEKTRIFHRPRFYAGLHATLAAMTFGIWIVPWISYTLYVLFWAPRRCSWCGNFQSSGIPEATASRLRPRLGMLNRIVDPVGPNEDPIKNILIK